jgi:hypothetical protein
VGESGAEGCIEFASGAKESEEGGAATLGHILIKGIPNSDEQ